MNNRDKLLKANNLAGMEIDKEVRKDHPYNDEVAILRKTLHALIHNEPIPEEFEAYHAEAERKKAEVKAHLAESRQSIV